MAANPVTATLVPEAAGAQPAPWNEERRIAALRAYDILDTPREQDFDDLVQVAAQVCGAPISVINLIEDTRQWFKAEVGLGVRETPLDVSICSRILTQPGLTVVPDLTHDPRFNCNPLVTGDPKLRFYAGALLETSEGLPLGTLCVLDHAARPDGLTDQQAFTLKALARQVITQLELRRALAAKTRAEEQKDFLVRELHHRVKNTLATVQAIMNSTARTAASIDAFKTAFMGRVTSLAKTHSLLTEQQWQVIPFRDILCGELEPYDDGTGSRIRLRGGPVELPSDIALSLGMAVHELTTNAAKYGSLSELGGSVEVAWAVVTGEGGRTLQWDWIECGGPPVTPPEHQGFGSRLLQRVLTTQTRAEVDMDYSPQGLRVRVELPLPPA